MAPNQMMRPVRIVVLGTGTGVGKTWVSCSLSRALRAAGAEVAAVKPIETGVAVGPQPLVGACTDAELLRDASSRPPLLPPVRLHDAVSPHLAARRADMEIRVKEVVCYLEEVVRDMACSVPSFCIVESAGGAFTPLAPGVTNADLADALEPAVWLLVAPDALGVLHDVSATLRALAAGHRAPDYLVVSAARGADASTGTNAEELRTLGIASPVALLREGDESAIAPLATLLIARAERALGRV